MKYIKYKKIAFVLASCMSATATLPKGYEEFKGLKTNDCKDMEGFDLHKGGRLRKSSPSDIFIMSDEKSILLKDRYSNWLRSQYGLYSIFQDQMDEGCYAQIADWDKDSVLKVAVLAALEGKGLDVDAIKTRHFDDFKVVEDLKIEVKEAGLELSEEELNSKNLFGQGMFLQKLLRDHDNANLERENESLKSALEKFSKSSETAEKGDFKFGLPEGYEEFKGLKTQDCLGSGFDEVRGAFICNPLFGGSESFVLFGRKSISLSHKYSNWLEEKYGSYSSFQSQMDEASYAQVADWDKNSVLKVAVLAALEGKGLDVDAIKTRHFYDSQAVEELKTQVKKAGLEFSEEELNSKRLFNQALFLQNLLRDQNNANLESEKAQLVSENKSLKSKLAKMDKDFETTEKMLNQERADFKFTVEGLKFESKKVNEELERVKEEFKLNEAELSKENAELVERLSQVQKEFIDETRRLEDVNEELGIDVREAEEAFHVAFAQISGKVDDILKTLGKTDADLEDLNLNEKLMMLKSGAEDSHWVFA